MTALDPAETACPTCGALLLLDQVCPRCLLRMALSPAEDTASSAEAGVRCIGDYLLGKQIGAGGMGVVYEARRISDGRSVAVKLIRDFHLATAMALRRFTLEAEAAARLDHPNIVSIHEIGECEGQPFLAMDLIAGESLSARVLPTRELALSKQRELARLMAKIARAVHHAHTRGVLHRDLKPGNILIDREGEPHLTDFGLAKILQRGGTEPDVPALTTSADTPGTPAYMAPEQILRADVGLAADVYGLGAVLYALLTGRPPFQGAAPLELFKQIVEQPPLRPRAFHRSLHTDLETICLKCLEKNPHHRYGAALALAEDLDSFATAGPITARRATPVQRASQWAKRNPVGSTLIASLGVGLSVALLLLNIVNQQRREIELDRDQAFDESMQEVSQIWRDPATKAVTISARDLAILAGRPPAAVRGAQHQFIFAVSANDGPSSMAQRYAHLLGTLQDQMGRHMGEKTVFHLRLLKRFSQNDEVLLGGDAHFVVMSAVEFVRAQERAAGVAAVAHANTKRRGVVFASAKSGVRNLTELRGKTLAFPDPDLAITVAGKARLFSGGLPAAALASSRSIMDQSPNGEPAIVSATETIERVLRGEADAGVAYRSHFERHKHLGLVLLEEVPDTPDVLAAQEGLNPRFIQTLRAVLDNFENSASWPEDRFVAVSDTALGGNPLQDLREAIRRAALFEER